MRANSALGALAAMTKIKALNRQLQAATVGPLWT
jgi:hypothetical protein